MRKCDATECDRSAFPHEPCECTHVLDLPFNRTVQLVLTNLGIAGFGMHPVHLHGHSFQVLKIGMPPVFPTTGSVCKWEPSHAHPTCLENKDVACVNGTGCAQARWADGVPVLDMHKSPVRKDTVIVPPGGYAVIRFRTDNPGWWHLHCHMAHHMQSGMGMILNEAMVCLHLSLCTLSPVPDLCTYVCRICNTTSSHLPDSPNAVGCTTAVD